MTQPDEPERVEVIKREVGRPRWTTAPRVGIVYSAENWECISALVNDLRYELTTQYNFSPLNIKLTQTEDIMDIALYATHLHQRSDIVFALGVVYEDSPLFERRLVDTATQRIATMPMPGRIPIFDCIVVRESKKQLDAQIKAMGKPGFAGHWARRAIDACMITSKPNM
ncbi:hypothetical protein GGF46_003432 [Coemansia sp. RSA 552]|nr:hypothetical protein GGF46_003432 [Coemansia sp. RSA 552]